MIFGNELQLSLNGLNLWVLDQIYKDEFTLGNINDYELMQYTEHKGKNNAEIWDGDVVEESYINHLNGIVEKDRYVVIKDNGNWKLKDVKNRPGRDRFLFLKKQHCQIIGNIYENPELLEVQNG